MAKKFLASFTIAQNIELKEQNNQNENHFDTLPMLINQITPSKIHIIPNTILFVTNK